MGRRNVTACRIQTGRGVGARGGWPAGRGWFCWNVLRSVRARFEVLARRLVFVLCLSYVSIGMSLSLDLRLSCGSFGMSYVRSRLLFAAWRQTGRLAGGCVSIPPWVEIAGSAFSNWRCGYRAWRVHFGLARFFVAIPTEDEGTRKRGTESAARRGRVFAWTYWLCNVFRGEYAGATGGSRTAAAPQTAPRRLVSLDSLHWIRDVGAFHAARASRVQRRLDRLQ